MSPDAFAQRARDLIADEVLSAAFSKVRQEALEALAVTDADKTIEIQRLQAIVAAVTEVQALLEDAIIATGAMDGGLALNEPTAH